MTFDENRLTKERLEFGSAIRAPSRAKARLFITESPHLEENGQVLGLLTGASDQKAKSGRVHSARSMNRTRVGFISRVKVKPVCSWRC
jgi:hypothetical protein